jgi:hypothetical protein
MSAHDGERITLRRGKGGGKVEVSIRCTKALMLDDMSRRRGLCHSFPPELSTDDGL